MVLGEWMGANFSHCDWQRSCDLLHHDKTSAPNSSTPSTSPMLVSFFRVSFAFLYCSNTNLFAMTVDRFLAITKPLRYMSYMTKETVWVMIITVWNGPFLLFFLPSIFTYNHNPTFTMFVEISRVLIFQILPLVIFVAATSHLLRIAWKVNRQTRELIAQVRHNHAMNMSGQNIQPPAVFRVQHRSSTVLIILVMTAFNITYLGGNYHCLCFLTNLCPFAGTLRYMVYLVLIANTAVNPVLYSFFKSDIQKELFKLFSR